jgi:hypothetical protein
VRAADAAEALLLGLGLAHVLPVPAVGVVIHADHLSAHAGVIEPLEAAGKIGDLIVVGNVEDGVRALLG